MSDIDKLRSITPGQMIEACEAANRWFRYGRKDKKEMSAAEVDIMRAGLRAAAATLRAYDADRALIDSLVSALRDLIGIAEDYVDMRKGTVTQLRKLNDARAALSRAEKEGA